MNEETKPSRMVLLLEGQNLCQRVDCAFFSGANSRHDGVNWSMLAQAIVKDTPQTRDVDTGVKVHGNVDEVVCTDSRKR